MATVTGFTADRMLAMEDATIIDGNVVGDNLILTTKGGMDIDAGPVVGPQGDTGPMGPGGGTVGMLADFPKLPLPSGWLACDGSLKNISAYPDLAAYLGTTYGGDGVTTFGLPNYAGLVRVGQDLAQTEFDTVGESGGEKSTILVVGNMPSHTHAHSLVVPNHNHSMAHTHPPGTGAAFWVNQAGGYNLAAGGGPVTPANNTGTSSAGVTAGSGAISLSGSISSVGSGIGHNNLPPYKVVVTAIKT